ncbi:unnamed protein product [Arctia plantaginis]|nr:unnamed protein product [Arctia plantaginis]
MKSTLWGHGPKWLWLPRAQWPQTKFLAPETDILHSEITIEKSVNTVTEKEYFTTLKTKMTKEQVHC